jgi:hypothetical protein
MIKLLEQLSCTWVVRNDLQNFGQKNCKKNSAWKIYIYKEISKEKGNDVTLVFYFRGGRSGVSLWTGKWNLRVHKTQETTWVAVWLVVSQGGLWSFELLSYSSEQMGSWGPLSLFRFAYFFLLNCLVREANNRFVLAAVTNLNLTFSSPCRYQSAETQFMRGNGKWPLACLSAKISGQLNCNSRWTICV